MPPDPKSKPIEIKTSHPEPKQFVRTFASDSAAVQKGDLPGFAEVVPTPEPPPVPKPVSPTPSKPEPSEPQPKPTPLPPIIETDDLLKNESLIPPSVSHEVGGSFFPKFSFTKEAPQETPSFRPTDLPQSAEPTITENPEPSALSRLIEGSILPSFSFKKEPPAPSFIPPPPPTPVKKEAAPIHTYTSDFAAHIKEEKASSATVLAAEGDANTKTIHTGTSFNIPLIIGGVVFVLASAGGAYGTYLYLNKPVPVQVTAPVATRIFVNERQELSGEGKELENAIVASLAKNLAVGQVRMLYTATATTTGNDVFNALKYSAPNVLARNIEANGSMAGIVHVGSASTPFFILSVSEYGETFSGMLAWEPRMGNDVAALFAPSATTTRPFRDEVLANHDVRVLRDVEGQSILIYGYWDLSTLIIARDETAYQELLKRLSTSGTTQ